MGAYHTHSTEKEQIGVTWKNQESVKQRRKFYKGMQKGFIHSFDNASCAPGMSQHMPAAGVQGV